MGKGGSEGGLGRANKDKRSKTLQREDLEDENSKNTERGAPHGWKQGETNCKKGQDGENWKCMPNSRIGHQQHVSTTKLIPNIQRTTVKHSRCQASCGHHSQSSSFTGLTPVSKRNSEEDKVLEAAASCEEGRALGNNPEAPALLGSCESGQVVIEHTRFKGPLPRTASH